MCLQSPLFLFLIQIEPVAKYCNFAPNLVIVYQAQQIN